MPSAMPVKVSTPASAISNASMVRGRAPTERKMAISRRRSFKVVRIMVTMPSRAVATTMADTTFKAVSAVPTSPHSSCNAAPGRIADSGSAPILVDLPLQTKRRQLRLETNEGRRDRFRLQIHPAHFVGRYALPGDPRSALPIHVNGLDRLQTDVHGAIDRRAGLFQDAGDAKGFVVVLDERDRAQPMRDNNRVTNPVPQGRGDIGSDHGIEQVVEGRTRAKREPVRLPKAGSGRSSRPSCLAHENHGDCPRATAGRPSPPPAAPGYPDSFARSTLLVALPMRNTE